VLVYFLSDNRIKLRAFATRPQFSFSFAGSWQSRSTDVSIHRAPFSSVRAVPVSELSVYPARLFSPVAREAGIAAAAAAAAAVARKVCCMAFQVLGRFDCIVVGYKELVDHDSVPPLDRHYNLVEAQR